MKANLSQSGSYLNRLTQLIPTEIVAAHLAVQGLVADEITIRNTGLEASAAILLFALPFYQWRIQGVRSITKVLLTMCSFIVWVIAVSSPLYTRWSIDPTWGAIALIIWTTVVPAFYGKGSTQNNEN